jgi:hypothetical protein
MFCSSASLVQTRAISTRRERLSAVIVVDAARKHSRASSRYFSPQRCISPRPSAALKKFQTWGAIKVPNSPGCRYRVQCSCLMTHRMVREEAARKPEPECRPTPALGTRGKAVNILLTGPKAKSRGTLIVVSRFCGLALAFFSVVEISLHSPGFHGAPLRASGR